MWHDIWKNSDRLGTGIIHKIKCSCKLKYKSAIREAFHDHENEHNDELYEHFLNKKYQNFGNVGPQNFTKTFQKSLY